MQIKTIYAIIILEEKVSKNETENPLPDKVLFCFDSNDEAIEKASELKIKHPQEKYVVRMLDIFEFINENVYVYRNKNDSNM